MNWFQLITQILSVVSAVVQAHQSGTTTTLNHVVGPVTPPAPSA